MTALQALRTVGSRLGIRLSILLLASCTPAVSGSPRAPCAIGETALSGPALLVLRETGIDPDQVRCNSSVRWERGLNRYAKEIVEGIAEQWGASPDPAARKRASHHALGYLVRSYFEQTRLHNLGVMKLRGLSSRDASGRERPLLVFRSGLVFEEGGGPSACFRSLIEHAHVRHVVNLYTGTFPFRDLIAEEKRFASRLGASYFDANQAPAGNWRQLVEEEQDFAKNLPRVTEGLAALIREQILAPGGAPPRGNIYFHCGGGMHRSGMVFGVLRRCINGDPLPLIEEEYRRHTSWRSEREPGGFEPLNLQLIRSFDCGLLRAAASAPSGR
jgi:hypothetical protein